MKVDGYEVPSDWPPAKPMSDDPAWTAREAAQREAIRDLDMALTEAIRGQDHDGVTRLRSELKNAWQALDRIHTERAPAPAFPLPPEQRTY